MIKGERLLASQSLDFGGLPPIYMYCTPAKNDFPPEGIAFLPSAMFCTKKNQPHWNGSCPLLVFISFFLVDIHCFSCCYSLFFQLEFMVTLAKNVNSLGQKIYASLSTWQIQCHELPFWDGFNPTDMQLVSPWGWCFIVFGLPLYDLSSTNHHFGVIRSVSRGCYNLDLQYPDCRWT